MRSLLLLACVSLLGACANKNVDPLDRIGKEKTPVARHTCLSQVGTHIKRPGRCVNAPGRVYTNGGADIIGPWWNDPAVRIGR
jgi:hypothetical protein